MAKKQTRRSVSMSREAYDKIKKHSEDTGKPMSWILEEWIAALPEPKK